MKENQEISQSYLTFKLGEEEFGVHVSQVLNILDMTRITQVPRAPDYMKGVINLRGTVLPVIDIRIKFGMPDTGITYNTCIVVLDLDLEGEAIQVGAIVDEVVSVIEVEGEQVEAPPSINGQYPSDFISGMARMEEHFIMLLDMRRVLGNEDLTEVADASVGSEAFLLHSDHFLRASSSRSSPSLRL